MRTAVGCLSWVEWDAGMAIAARAARSFAQSAVAVLIAIYLGLHGFSLGWVGALMLAPWGAALPPLWRGAGRRRWGKADPRDPGRLLMALAVRMLVVSESFPVLLIAAFVGNLSGFVGGERTRIRSNRPFWPSL